jgi:Predicted membrane protein (DUF2142)
VTGILRRFVVAFACAFAISAIWSLAVPLLSGPDEASHAIKATGVIRGQFVGNCQDRGPAPCPDSGPLGALSEVHVPAFYALLEPDRNVASEAALNLQCESHHPSVPASCQVFPEPKSLVGLARDAWVHDGRYPPEYYLLVGIPSLFGSGRLFLYLMRLMAAGCCSVLVALACTACSWARSRAPLLGVALGATPLLFYLSGVVNPSGLESAAALATWAAGAVLVLERRDEPTGLVAILASSAVVCSLVRSLSPLWLLAIALVLALIAPPGRLRELGRSRKVRFALGAVACSSAAALTWTLYEHATNVVPAASGAALPAPGSSLAQLFLTAFRHNNAWLPTLVGVFGSYDTRMPLVSYLAYYLLLGGVALLALRRGSRRERLVLLLLALAIATVPPAIVATHAKVDGFLWNGRDTLPLAVGLGVLVAIIASRQAASRDDSRDPVPTALPRLWVLLAMALLVVTHAGALFAALRRYSVGTSGPVLSFLWHASWHPPLGVAPTLALGLAAELLAVTLLARELCSRDPMPGAPAGGRPAPRATEVDVDRAVAPGAPPGQ